MDPVHTVAQREAIRGQECPYRRQKSCGRIDLALGWVDGVDIDTCDACWAAGPDGLGAVVRDAYAAKVIQTVKDKGLEHYKPVVQLSVMGRHMTPEEAAASRLRIADYARLLAVRAEESPWEGVPYPKRLIASVRAAGRAFKRSMKSFPGCGCYKPLKRLVKRA